VYVPIGAVTALPYNLTNDGQTQPLLASSMDYKSFSPEIRAWGLCDIPVGSFPNGCSRMPHRRRSVPGSILAPPAYVPLIFSLGT